MSTSRLTSAPTGARAPRYARGQRSLAPTVPSPRRQPTRPLSAPDFQPEDFAIEENPLELIAPELTGQGLPVSRRLRKAGHVSRRLTALVAASLAAALGVGMFTTGAFFTDGRQIVASQSLGDIKLTINTPVNGGGSQVPFTLTKLVPLSATDAADTTKGTIINFTVNGAKLDARARMQILNEGSISNPDMLPYIMVQLYNGSTWSTPTPVFVNGGLPDLVSDEFTVAKNSVSGNLSARIYLRSDTPDRFQNSLFSFYVVAKSIQQTAPAGSAY